jgi:signal transduction histidine kinase
MDERAPQEDLFPSGSTSATWLKGGGEMGALIRSYDWSRHSMGPLETWPMTLRIALGICLGSRFPMALWWGPGLFQFYNDGYRPVLGDKHPRSLGQRGNECWSEIWDVVGPFYQQVMTTGEPTFSSDLLLLMERSGYLEETYFTFSYSPIRDERGDIGGNLITCSETTERVLGERRLRTLRDLAARGAEGRGVEEACAIAAEALASNPVDIPFAVVYLLDPEGSRLRRAATCRVPGVGSGFGAVLSDLDAPEGLPGFAEAVREGKTVRIDGLEDCCAGLSSGSWPSGPWPDPPVSALVVPLAAPGQERPAGVLFAGISPRRALDEPYSDFFGLVAGQIATAINNARTYEEERRRAEALAELDRAKTAFFNNVSHELRTPLTLLLGPLEDSLAADPPLPPERRAALETVHRNALRLLKLVNTLLDFSRIEAGRMTAFYEPTDLCVYTAELASSFRSAIERAGLRFVVDCAPLDAEVWVDREMWEKIVLNLLSNAFKFTPEGEIAIRLRGVGDIGEEGEEGRERVELTVEDTGVGIPPEEIDHVFERFHRVRATRARSYEGTGIGLALVQELIRMHGGEIQVRSRMDGAAGSGTTFTVTLPTGTAHLPQGRLGTTRAATTDAPSAFQSPYVEEARRWLPEASDRSGDAEAAFPGEDRARILLADDNADMRDYLRRLLGDRWSVEAVGDGAAALASALAAPPDLVIADVMMPELDGFELLQALRSDVRTRELPLILLSARAGEEAQVEGLAAGADDYLVKPFSARELTARVRAHLASARVRRQAAERERAARLEAEAAARAKDEFLAMLSHELRNPLGAIGNAAQALEAFAPADGRDDERERRLVRIIGRQSRHLTRLLDDLLDVARVTAGKISLHREVLDLTDVVERCRRTLEARGRTGDHQLEITTVPAWVDGDPTRLEQVVANLLENAIKYTPSGGIIRIRLAPEGDEAVLRIQDTGRGISPEMLPRIFDLFVQDASPLDRTDGGLGIGLTLVRRLVEMHGGRVDARSGGIGQGTELTVRLPLHAASSAAESPEAEPASSTRRVLIIEDNDDARESLRLLLELEGHIVFAADDGPSGLALAFSSQPDFILLDIGLPGLNGYEVAQALADHPERSRVRVVALTGYGQETDRRRSSAAGFDLHLVKPVEPGRLRELLTEEVRPLSDRAVERKR